MVWDSSNWDKIFWRHLEFSITFFLLVDSFFTIFRILFAMKKCHFLLFFREINTTSGTASTRPTTTSKTSKSTSYVNLGNFSDTWISCKIKLDDFATILTCFYEVQALRLFFFVCVLSRGKPNPSLFHEWWILFSAFYLRRLIPWKRQRLREKPKCTSYWRCLLLNS